MALFLVCLVSMPFVSSLQVKRKFALQDPQVLGSIPSPTRFDQDGRRTDVWLRSDFCVVHIKKDWASSGTALAKFPNHSGDTRRPLGLTNFQLSK
uniref:Putative secreted protein n=1 Tax=Ixodes ricinus TaxID=34613 RepID=A0A6B0U5Z4_IXORI